jgi:Rrf2 family protein
MVRSMEITRKTEYAVSALVELASHPGEYISSKVIAGRQEIPVNFLPQIIALLGTRGWVVGVRGPGGGVRLEVDPATITLEDVIELVEGPIAISKCLAGDLECPRKGECPMQPIWIEAQQAFVDVLRSRTIADLVQNTPEKEASGRKYMSGVE